MPRRSSRKARSRRQSRPTSRRKRASSRKSSRKTSRKSSRRLSRRKPAAKRSSRRRSSSSRKSSRRRSRKQSGGRLGRIFGKSEKEKVCEIGEQTFFQQLLNNWMSELRRAENYEQRLLVAANIIDSHSNFINGLDENALKPFRDANYINNNNEIQCKSGYLSQYNKLVIKTYGGHESDIYLGYDTPDEGLLFTEKNFLTARKNYPFFVKKEIEKRTQNT